jgi:hypothetical protein
VPNDLHVYLRNHEAAASAGYDLIRRAASSQRSRPYGDTLTELAAEDRRDLDALRQLMAQLGVRPDRILGTAARLGERAGRLKPNGHLVRRAPVSDLVEVEGILDVLQLKAAGWRALAAAGVGPADPSTDLDTLTSRAEAQIRELTAVHLQVAGTVLGTGTAGH